MAQTKWTWPIRTAALLSRCLLIFLLAGVMVAATPIPTKPDLEDRVRYSQQEIRRAITFYANRYRLDPALLHAVIKTESDFRQDAVSRKGAIGLMQLTPDTAATLRVADVYDSLQNIRGGAKQLRHLLNLYEGDLLLALAAYNAGVHRVKGGKIPRIRETRLYVRKVLRYYEHYRQPRRCGRSAPPIPCRSAAVPHRPKQTDPVPLKGAGESRYGPESG
ncbi:MAG: lytic transglycosylase domain-containing protein [Nitrospira sp.]|nr:lytic transglycosylase domain-containing protein [Nitrospira sp.]